MRNLKLETIILRTV